MNESIDRALADWLHEGPDSGPREGLDRTLAATRRVGQRPGWSFPERWLPMQLTMSRTPQRPIAAIAMLALLLVALVATALFAASQRRDAPPPFRNGAIVYEQDGDLFIVDQLGAAPRPLVADPSADSGPVFSPQGDRIAFARDAGRDGWGVMTIRPDGSGLTELGIAPDTIFGGPRLIWAPDGSALIANSQFPTCCPGLLYLFQSDGSPSRTIDFDGDVALQGHTSWQPGASWRPGGGQIAFVGSTDIGDAAFIAGADGTNVRRVPVGTAEVVNGPLEWSPDGKHLSFWSGNPDDFRITIADIDADGAMTGSHQLSTEFEDSGRLGEKLGPTWSPDGRHLALVQKQGSTVHVQILEPDGSGNRIEGPAVTDLWPDYFAWSPDGRSLAVSGDALWNDPATQSHRMVRKAWSLDVASGEWTELQTPVESWQRLAP